MATHPKHGRPDDPLARQPSGGTPGDMRRGEHTPTGQSHYHELGLKEQKSPLAPRTGSTADDAPMVDKSDASAHQAEGPGGKGTGGGGGGA
ncbi:hypothetical protein [Polyangium sp. 6x1]|uniref:hypothetical protein n=1 Tax=Polyangium sp. 6x1 TaxID=3042689 RepID=UPI0024830A6A|nr:hypothetical protein [Polyangium sp. 6x1]MDI1442789.1 hypothetical protein [Polyangium sp. 6x1]